MSIKKLTLFGVAVREKNNCDSWEVVVVSETVREARKIRVSAVETEGLVKRENIANTLVWEKIEEVWQ